MTTTAVAENSKNPLVVLRSQLESRIGELRNALPQHMPPERFIRVVLTAVQLNADLLACSRQSLWNAAMRAAQDGLLPDGRDGAIVPFKDQATWMPMVGGLLKRFRNSGQFKSIATGIVREGEEFDYWIDETGEHLKHRPGDGTGAAIKAYAIASTKDGGVMARVMSVADINKRRAASRSKNSPMWNDWWDEAAMKTVLRNLHKRLPSSSDLDDLMRRDDELYDFQAAREAGKPAQITNVAGALEHFSTAMTAPKEETIDQDTGEITEQSADDNAKVDEGLAAEHAAFDAGKLARAQGVQRRAVPGEYRTQEATALAAAWLKGWDVGVKAIDKETTA